MIDPHGLIPVVQAALESEEGLEKLASRLEGVCSPTEDPMAQRAVKARRSGARCSTPVRLGPTISSFVAKPELAAKVIGMLVTAGMDPNVKARPSTMATATSTRSPRARSRSNSPSRGCVPGLAGRQGQPSRGGRQRRDRRGAHRSKWQSMARVVRSTSCSAGMRQRPASARRRCRDLPSSTRARMPPRRRCCETRKWAAVARSPSSPEYACCFLFGGWWVARKRDASPPQQGLRAPRWAGA